ncbi:putative tRNA/rRNA methyltransferase [Wickerhamomyces ciferrii]|uniref:rRNA methyltransferase 1, mitochondrial n=1 Tax=Wickerhamomyces ciferrii (strain ATCC 14091 / BCRC 22168 / CBS 111 / JCM 3599 / NBRC 0793 / NRRL Y-1031 F-60-10) TaxID=1206466 RepID=K0KKX5_WICCF|nr:putative tRNA/rRNA methyltransferase [Wickerhamomyces ciferrii]CCH42109.1 putative tRNA/rRNA methyltransferase [Wickerhamomyces ciferrii]
MFSVRRFSTSSTHFKRILPAFTTGNKSNRSNTTETFNKNFPIHKKVKAWEKTGEDKETYFKRKHAHHHAQEKERNPNGRNGKNSSRVKDSYKDDKKSNDKFDSYKKPFDKKDGKSFEKPRYDRKDDKRSFEKPRYESRDKSYEKPRFDRRDDRKSYDRPSKFESRDDKRSFDKPRYDRRSESKYDTRDDGYESKSYSRNPYSGLKTSPLSDFLYGSSAVYAALKSNKREFFTKLLYYNYKIEDQKILDLASKLKIPIKESKDKNELNILTNNSVHNGIVLETKPLIPDTILELGKFNTVDGTYSVGHDDLGDLVSKYHTSSNPFPLGVYLDEVSDPHNVGAIIRSAYFLGVDFIIVSSKNSSGITPAVVKTSSGASEFIPIYKVDSPLKFLNNSSEKGWKIISSGQASHPKDSKINKTLEQKALHFNDLDQLLIKSPTLLVVGSEGDGIRTTIKLRSDYIVEIEKGNNVDPTIDSLNVSVASALMIKQLMSY